MACRFLWWGRKLPSTRGQGCQRVWMGQWHGCLWLSSTSKLDWRQQLLSPPWVRPGLISKLSDHPRIPALQTFYPFYHFQQGLGFVPHLSSGWESLLRRWYKSHEAQLPFLINKVHLCPHQCGLPDMQPGSRETSTTIWPTDQRIFMFTTSSQMPVPENPVVSGIRGPQSKFCLRWNIYFLVSGYPNLYMKLLEAPIKMKLLVWLVPCIGNLDVGIVVERRKCGLVTFINRPTQAQCWGRVLVMKNRNT